MQGKLFYRGTIAHVAKWEKTIVVQLALQTKRTHQNSNIPIKNKNRMKPISQP
jgi:hypothetical protein